MTRKANISERNLELLANKACEDFDEIFAGLQLVAAKCERIAQEELNRHGTLKPGFVKTMRPDLVRTLAGMVPIVYSVSIVIDDHVIPGVPFELHMIERDGDGVITDDSNVRYPWRAAFYEYSNAEWMVVPRASHRPEVVGPFVDFDKYIFSLVTPIYVAEQFIGVAAADIRLSDYERRLAQTLSRFSNDVAVINSAGRVVLSNCSSQPVGSLVDTAGIASKACGSSEWSAVLFA